MKKASRKLKMGYILLSLVISGCFCIGVSRDSSKSSTLSLQQSTVDTYVLDNIDIDYLYDKDNYEIESFINDPYAVVKGNATTINRLKMLKKKPTFYVDLRDKKPGTYQQKIMSKGLEDEKVTISVYPVITELKLRELQTVTYTPIFEYVNMKEFDSEHYTLNAPALAESVNEIKVRDTQQVLGDLGKLVIYLDVANLTETTTRTLKIHAFDTKGRELKDVKLLTKEIPVTIPVESKVREVVDTSQTKVLESEIAKLQKELASQKKSLEHSTTKENVNAKEESKMIQKLEQELAKKSKEQERLRKEKESTLAKALKAEKAAKQAAKDKQRALDERDKAQADVEKKEQELAKKEAKIQENGHRTQDDTELETLPQKED